VPLGFKKSHVLVAQLSNGHIAQKGTGVLLNR
jgi:hypothetical protein